MFGVLAFTLLYRLLTLPFPVANGDAARKWMWARVVRAGWSPAEALWEGWDHHAARLAINVPTLLAQSLFGDHPVVYYVTPLAANLLAVACLFFIGLRAGGLGVATWSCVVWAWVVPPSWVAQLMPSAFTPAYVLATLLCLIRVVEAEGSRARWGWLLAAGATMMLAELTKVTNLFFVPGLMLGLWLATRRLSLALGFAAVVVALMLGEWAAYRASSLDFPWGRVSVVLQEHLEGAAVDRLKKIDGFWGLITRQQRAFSETRPGFYLWAMIAVGVYCLARIRRVPLGIQLLVPATLSYLFFHVFAVHSLDPLKAVQRPLVRYLAELLPLAILALIWFPSRWLRYQAPEGRRDRPVLVHGVAFAVVLGYAYMAYFPGWKQHPIARLVVYEEMVQDAYARGIPIVSDRGARYSLHSLFALFWDDFEGPSHRVSRQVPAPGAARTGRRNRKFRYLIDPEKTGGLVGGKLVRTWKGGDSLLFQHKGERLRVRRQPFDALYR